MISEYNIGRELSLYKRINEDSPYQTKVIGSSLQSMSIQINIQGKASYKSLVNDYKGVIEDNQTFINVLNKDEGILEEKTKVRNYINIVIKKDFLKQNLPDNSLKEKVLKFFESDANVENLSHQKINPRTKLIALELLNNQYTNNLEKLFLESKTLELIYNEFSNLCTEEENRYNKNIYLSKQDKEAIFFARDILIANMANPPSIKELSKMVSTNELKIKTGFHKYFNDTPYNMLLEHKMQEAKKLLENSDLNINEISQQLGYKYHQNFSKAFIKRFGVPPKELMKSRKYYY